MTRSRAIAVLLFTLAGCRLGLPPPAPVSRSEADRPSYAGYCSVAAELADGRASWRFGAAYALLSVGAAGAALSPLVAARIDDETSASITGMSTAIVSGAIGGAGYLLLIAAENNAAAAGGFAECVGVDDDAVALAVARSVYQRWTQGNISVSELLREVGKLTAAQPPATSAPTAPPEPPEPPDVEPEARILEAAR